MQLYIKGMGHLYWTNFHFWNVQIQRVFTPTRQAHLEGCSGWSLSYPHPHPRTGAARFGHEWGYFPMLVLVIWIPAFQGQDDLQIGPYDKMQRFTFIPSVAWQLPAGLRCGYERTSLSPHSHWFHGQLASRW